MERSRIAAIAALAVFYLLAVHLPDPSYWTVLPLVSAAVWILPHVGEGWAETWLGWPVLLAPCAALFALALLPRIRGSGGRWAVLALSWIFAILATFDAALSALFIGGASTPSNFAVSVIVGATVVAWAALFVSLTAEALGQPDLLRRPLRQAAVAVIVGVSLWSLAVLAAASFSAVQAARGRPYCIAQPGGPEDYLPIDSTFDLRGSQLYADRTGYKDSSRWYFNAVLIVEDGDQRLYLNWSYTLMRFDYLGSDDFIADIRGACEPVPGFLSRLPGSARGL